MLKFKYDNAAASCSCQNLWRILENRAFKIELQMYVY